MDEKVISEYPSSAQASPPKDCVVPRCSICKQIPVGGIRGGFKLRRAFLCLNCESIIMATPVGSDDYHRIMAGLRSIY